MSYNINTFKLKSLKLTLPANFDMRAYVTEKTGWEDKEQIVRTVDGTVWKYNENGEGFSASGEIDKDGNLTVRKIACWAECSGYMYEDVLKPMLQEFKGDIEAVTVWEGGDSILELKAKGGEIEESEIDL